MYNYDPEYGQRLGVVPCPLSAIEQPHGIYSLLVDHESGLRARVSILITEGPEEMARRLGTLLADHLQGLKWDPETEEVL